MRRFIGPVIACATLYACGHAAPTDNELRQALQEPLLDHVSVNGITLPKDSFTVDAINVVSINKHMVSDTPHFTVAANATVTLTKNGNDILLEIKQGIDGSDIGAILQLQQFVRSLGFTLKRGSKLNYKIEADVISENEKYVVGSDHIIPQ
ncbi:hypothetical protein EC912_108122 [Luteibacter rhizovicinus]|uniref:Lipoprotein n=1 Tax=Luteibacter rhizovicinus TaxID=242606 RepID=A0A4R3YL33_9GAMM|nr:hypothetical protein [Luteibacter rhizovicinus]TCV92128.1 hypothetical protein EC912_108122 [Luteibacter rhizovicinus]